MCASVALQLPTSSFSREYHRTIMAADCIQYPLGAYTVGAPTANMGHDQVVNEIRRSRFVPAYLQVATCFAFLRATKVAGDKES
jgi:hypothetical protein